MLDSAPQHNDRRSLGRERTSKQEGISSRLGTATGRYGSSFVTLKHSSCRETSHRAEVRQDEVERTRITQRHVRKRAVWVGLQVKKQGEGQTGKHLLRTEPWTDEEHGQRSPGMSNVQLNLKARTKSLHLVSISSF